jgi:hypothetical protein
MRVLVLIVFAFISVAVSAQTGKDAALQQMNQRGIIKEVFKGLIANDGQNIATVLTLSHLPYADDGDFTLSETYKDVNKKEQILNTIGDWTVIKGDAKNENATVVEIEAPQRIMFFLRLKNGNLQKLDTSLREIIPAVKYIRRTENESLAGTYTGSMPSAVCNRVETTLTLQCGPPCREGSFTLTEKYVGTPKAPKSSKVNASKGQWSFAGNTAVADSTKNVIVLDEGKPGLQSYYLVKENGNLLPLGKDLKKSNSPFDGMLQKK